MDLVKIHSLRIFRYYLPFAKALQRSNFSTIARDGLIIQLRSDQGKEGWGEVAPFPLLNPESLESCIEQLKRLKYKLSRETIPLDNLWNSTFNDLFPSVQYGIEMALWEMEDKLSGEGATEVPYQYLLSGKENEDELADLVKSYDHFKLKVMPGQNREFHSFISFLKSLGGERLKIRLDANGSFDLDEVIGFGKQLTSLGIDFIEEPTPNSDEWPAFYDACGIPVAVDESISHVLPQSWEGWDFLKAFIIKPTSFGRINQLFSLIEKVNKNSRECQLSSPFFSGLGLSFLIRLASLYLPNQCMGFGTYRWFTEDILFDPIPNFHGRIALNQLPNQLLPISKTSMKEILI